MANNNDFLRLQEAYSLFLEGASAEDVLKTGLDMAKKASTPTKSAGPEDEDFEDVDDDALKAASKSVEKQKTQKELDREARLNAPYKINDQDTDLTIWDHKLLEAVLVNAYDTQVRTQKNQAVLIYGDSGIGKSYTAADFAAKMATHLGLGEAPKKWGQDTPYLDLGKLTEQQIDKLIAENKADQYFTFHILDAKSYNPTDYEGVPRFPGENEGDVRHLRALKFFWIRFLELKGTRGILFLDEMNHANEDVLNYMFNVIENHTFGTTKFSDDVLVVSAGNVGSGHGNTKDLPQALENRFYQKGVLILDPDDWIEWARKRGIDNRIVQFVLTNPYRFLGQQDLIQDPNDNKKQYTAEERANKKTAPTPRNIERLNDFMHTIIERFDKTGNRDRAAFREEVVKAAGNCCGREWGNKFNDFLRKYDEFSLKSLLRKSKEKSPTKDGRMIPLFKSDSQNQEELYSIPAFLLTVVKPITNKMVLGAHADEEGELEFGEISDDEKKKLQAVILISLACKPEIQTQIIDTIRSLPKEERGAFGWFAVEGDYNREARERFRTELKPMYESCLKSEAQLKEDFAKLYGNVKKGAN